MKLLVVACGLALIGLPGAALAGEQHLPRERGRDAAGQPRRQRLPPPTGHSVGEGAGRTPPSILLAKSPGALLASAPGELAGG